MTRLDVIAVGESLISYRASGPLTLGNPVVPRLAGAESNVAIGLARLGHRVAWVGRVGTDRFGDLVLSQLAAERVDTSYAVRDAGAPTGLMFTEQRTSDLTQVEYRRAGSAGSRLAITDVLPALAARPRLVHLSGITPGLSSTLPQQLATIARDARADGAQVSLDVNYRSRLWSRAAARSALAAIVTHCDLLIASADELDLVAPADGASEDAAVAHLLGLGVARVAVKRGHLGATYYLGADRVDLPAVPVTAVDPIGAGDAFSAGLISASLDGLPAEAQLRRAVTAGAFVVSSHGDWEGAPRRAELELLARPDWTVR